MIKDTFDADGKLHSFDDESAVVYNDGAEAWYKHGMRHRDNDRPAIVCSNGDLGWWKDGKLHRDNDKPAIIYSDGTRYWYKNGKFHRDNGEPAIICTNGLKYWYINGIELSKSSVEFLKKIIAEEIKFLPWLLGEDPLLDCVIEKRMSEFTGSIV